VVGDGGVVLCVSEHGGGDIHGVPGILGAGCSRCRGGGSGDGARRKWQKEDHSKHSSCRCCFPRFVVLTLRGQFECDSGGVYGRGHIKMVFIKM